MLRIKHGQPKQTGYWPVVIPYTGDPMCEKVSIQDKELKQITLEDPNTGEETIYNIHDVWRFNASDGLGDAFSKLTYGISSEKLMLYLHKRYPNWDGKQVEFILIKKHE